MKKTQPPTNKKQKKTSLANEENLKKQFMESQQTEKFYQKILHYDLREEAYKELIKTYIELKE